MAKYNIDKKLNVPFYLLYSNSDSDFTFKEELSGWAKSNSNLKIEFIDTSALGHLDNTKVEKYLENWQLAKGQPTWWVTGPPAFIDAMEEVTEKLEISSAKLRSEKFTGY